MIDIKIENLSVEKVNAFLKLELTPKALRTILQWLAGIFGSYTTDLYHIQANKPIKWLQIKNSGDKPLSDTATEMQWRITDEGQKEFRLEQALKIIKMQKEAVNRILKSMDSESIGQY